MFSTDGSTSAAVILGPAILSLAQLVSNIGKCCEAHTHKRPNEFDNICLFPLRGYSHHEPIYPDIVINFLLDSTPTLK